MDGQSLTLIERNGSFGLLVVMMAALLIGIATLVRWVKNEAFPRCLAYLESKDREHAAERKEERDANLAALAKLAEKLDDHGERLDRIEGRLPDRPGSKR